jgi:hypothetical protein
LRWREHGSLRMSGFIFVLQEGLLSIGKVPLVLHLSCRNRINPVHLVLELDVYR